MKKKHLFDGSFKRSGENGSESGTQMSKECAHKPRIKLWESCRGQHSSKFSKISYAGQTETKVNSELTVSPNFDEVQS